MWPFKRKSKPIPNDVEKPKLQDAQAHDRKIREIQAACDRIRERLRPWCEKHNRKAWLPLTKPGDNKTDRSHFGGLPLLPRGQPWPTCGACGKPAPLCLQLDSRDIPVDAPRFGDGILQFFYCGNCETVATSEPWKAFNVTQTVRVVSAEGLELATVPEGVDVFPCRVIGDWRFHDDIPSSDDAESLGLELDCDEQYRLASIRSEECGVDIPDIKDLVGPEYVDEIEQELFLPMHGDKLGGWPYWVQGPEPVECSTCGQQMQMLFQIDSGANLDINLGDGGCGHLWQCPEHPDVIAFEWACM